MTAAIEQDGYRPGRTDHGRFPAIRKLNEQPPPGYRRRGTMPYTTPEIEGRVEPEDNANMEPPINRAELDSKLKNVELTLDRRIDGLEAKLDGIKDDVASTKSTVMWMAALVVGTIVSTAALVVSSFDSGRETAKMAVEAQRGVESNLQEMRRIVDELRRGPPAPTPTETPSPPSQPSK